MWNSRRRGFFLIATIAVGGIFVGTNGGRPSNIKNGINAGPYEGSFVVLLVVSGPLQRGECTGAIISPRHVITAGHCIDGKNKGVVYGGIRHRANPDVIVSNVAHFFKHPKYGTAYGGYDIGIVEVDKKLDRGGRQTAVPLTTRKVNFDRRGVTFGWSSCGEERLMILQKAFVDFLEDKDCDRLGGHGQYPQLLCISMGLSHPCRGDSGAPIVSDGSLVGIVTAVANQRGQPHTSQNLYFYLDWINFIVGWRLSHSGLYTAINFL